MPATARRIAGASGLLLAVLAAWSLSPLVASAQDQGAAERQIERSREQERALGRAAQRLAGLERHALAGIAVIERRQAQAQAELATAEQRLVRTERRLQAERRRLADQQRRLRRGRATLAANLRAAYTSDRPDLVTVVLEADGFADLIERVEYEQAARAANQRILRGVQAARRETRRRERALQAIAPDQRRDAAAVRRERDAIAQRAAALRSRRATLAQARQARLAAQRSARADRRRAQRTLNRLLDQQRRAATDTAGPGGPWAIPWAIVQCESGGQNLPPNAAGASGYYQFMPDTWRGLGGSTPHAYQAGKAEQDRLAAKLWNGGAGKGNWVCASIVGA